MKRNDEIAQKMQGEERREAIILSVKKRIQESDESEKDDGTKDDNKKDNGRSSAKAFWKKVNCKRKRTKGVDLKEASTIRTG